MAATSANETKRFLLTRVAKDLIRIHLRHNKISFPDLA